MNKTELVDTILSKTSNIKKKDVNEVVDAFCDVIEDELKNGNAVRLVGFGTFDVKEKAERNGINPLTKKPLTIPAHKIVRFAAGKTFKEHIQ